MPKIAYGDIVPSSATQRMLLRRQRNQLREVFTTDEMVANGLRAVFDEVRRSFFLFSSISSERSTRFDDQGTTAASPHHHIFLIFFHLERIRFLPKQRAAPRAPRRGGW